MSDDMVWKAKELLITQRDTSSIVVERLQDTQQRLDTNLKEAETRNAEADELKKHYEKELNEHKKEKKKSLKIIKDRFEGQLEQAKREIKDILTELRREKSEKIARRSYARLAQLEQNFRSDLHALEEKEQYTELDWDKVQVNDKSIAFYRDILGLKYQGEIMMVGEETDKMFQKKNCKARVAYLNGSENIETPPVELIQFVDSKIHKEQSDLFTTSISEVCFYTDDIDSVYKALIENHVECLSEPQYFDFRADGFGESRAFYFRDPDGIILEMMQPL